MSNAPALFVKHKLLARQRAYGRFIPGADDDDVHQIAMIGLWEACRAYDPAKGPFGPFAWLVMTRRLDEAVKRALRGKHRMLTDAVAIENALDHASPTTTEEIVLWREEMRELGDRAAKLTPLERRAISAMARGERPHVGGKDKLMDNAVQRARRKLRETKEAA